MGRMPSGELFCIFGDFYVPGMQDVEVEKSLVAFEQYQKFAFALFALVFFSKLVLLLKTKRFHEQFWF